MTDQFVTGAQRDGQDGKPRFDLIDETWLTELGEGMRGTWVYDHVTILHSINAGDYVTSATRAITYEYRGYYAAANDEKLNQVCYPALERLALLLASGAAKYGANNWCKGIPLWRINASLHRHFHKWLDGQDDEDHFAAVLFNCMAAHYVTRQVAAGALPASLLEPEDAPKEAGAGNVVWCEPPSAYIHARKDTDFVARYDVAAPVLPEVFELCKSCTFLSDKNDCISQALDAKAAHVGAPFTNGGRCARYAPVLPDVFELCKTCTFLSDKHDCLNPKEDEGPEYANSAHIISGYSSNCANHEARTCRYLGDDEMCLHGESVSVNCHNNQDGFGACRLYEVRDND